MTYPRLVDTQLSLRVRHMFRNPQRRPCNTDISLLFTVASIGIGWAVRIAFNGDQHISKPEAPGQIGLNAAGCRVGSLRKTCHGVPPVSFGDEPTPGRCAI
jgi:hypothetical protein